MASVAISTLATPQRIPLVYDLNSGLLLTISTWIIEHLKLNFSNI